MENNSQVEQCIMLSLALIREKVLRKECARNLRRSNKELLLEGIFTAAEDRVGVRGMFKGGAPVPSSSAAREGSMMEVVFKGVTYRDLAFYFILKKVEWTCTLVSDPWVPVQPLHTWEVTPGNKPPKMKQIAILMVFKTTYILPNAADF